MYFLTLFFISGMLEPLSSSNRTVAIAIVQRLPLQERTKGYFVGILIPMEYSRKNIELILGFPELSTASGPPFSPWISYLYFEYGLLVNFNSGNRVSNICYEGPLHYHRPFFQRKCNKR